MTTDVFGNLADWGSVLDRLQELREKELLDEHQAGLARMLRYRVNPHLMEQVFICAMDIKQASDVLIADLLDVVVSEEVALTFRTQAVRALGHLLVHRPPQTSEASLETGQIVEQLEDLAKRPGPPILTEVLGRVLGAVRRTSS